MVLFRAFCLLLTLFLFLPAPLEARPGEVRGTWITTTANSAIASPEDTAATMARLADLGFNTVYVECWKNGYTEFPSRRMDEFIGVEMKINDAPPELQRDLLEETVLEAHRNGLVAIGWFEYGFMAAYKDTDNELRRKGLEEGWLTTTKSGETVGEQNPFVWMNPLHPVPQQLLLDIVLEAVDQYDLDGVQLDDRIAMPVEMGYDDYTKALYAKEHDGRLPPEDPRDPAWIQWRADKISQYARQFATALKKKRPGLLVSVSPAPYPWSLENYACDWPQWLDWTTENDQPLWDEFVPQCYRFDFPAFETNWREQVAAVEKVAAGRTEDLIAGIRVVGDGPDTSWEDVARKMDLSRELGGGYCIWFSRAVLEVYPEQFDAYHEKVGSAHNPHFPEDWRPRAVSLQSIVAGETVVPPGHYQVLAREGGGWRGVGRVHFEREGSAVTLKEMDLGIPLKAGGTDVELLRDRRPDMTLAR